MFRFILTVCIVLVLVSSVFWYLRLEQSQSSMLVSDMRIELVDFLPTKIGSDSLSDDDIRLRYYTTLHLLDPKMALPGTDLSDLQATLVAMASSTRASREVYAEWIDTELLYPLKLLGSFARTESARRQLRSNPTTESVRRYHEELMSLFSEYETSLVEIENFLTEHATPGSAKFWQGTTRSSYVRDLISAIRMSIAAEKDLEEDRYSCVSRSAKRACPSITSLRNADLTDETDAADLRGDEERAVIARARFFEEQLELTRGQNPKPLITTDKLPLVMLRDNRCAPNGGPQFVSIYDIETRVSKLRALRLFGLDDIYLYDTWKEQESGFLPPEPKVPDKYRYTLQADNYYTCIDYGYDAHTALAIAYIRENLAEHHPTSTDSADTEAMSIASSAERLVNLKIPDDTTTDHLVSLIDSALFKNGRIWFDQRFGPENAERLIEYRDVWHAKTGYFELALATLDDFMVRSLYARPDGQPTIDAPWFFLSHSDMVSLYQLANETVTKDTPRLLKDVNIIGTTFPENFPGLVSYEKELKYVIPTHESLHSSTIEADQYIRDHLFKSE